MQQSDRLVDAALAFPDRREQVDCVPRLDGAAAARRGVAVRFCRHPGGQQRGCVLVPAWQATSTR
ncbi:hypothetical protein [Plantactinospora sp. WMMB782]|uniref:hypothetical protein n=1 Tax=Plantactinospora sp. WMMB782 TaxID=3404121 RepID=UPI003B952CD6